MQDGYYLPELMISPGEHYFCARNGIAARDRRLEAEEARNAEAHGTVRGEIDTEQYYEDNHEFLPDNHDDHDFDDEDEAMIEDGNEYHEAEDEVMGENEVNDGVEHGTDANSTNGEDDDIQYGADSGSYDHGPGTEEPWIEVNGNTATPTVHEGPLNGARTSITVYGNSTVRVGGVGFGRASQAPSAPKAPSPPTPPSRQPRQHKGTTMILTSSRPSTSRITKKRPPPKSKESKAWTHEEIRELIVNCSYGFTAAEIWHREFFPGRGTKDIAAMILLLEEEGKLVRRPDGGFRIDRL